MKDVAQRAGMSRPTVSDILNNKAHLYRPEVRERVLQAASSLGYRPNGYARAVKSGRFQNVCLLLPENYAHLPIGLVQGLTAALTAREMTLAIAQLPDAKLASEGYVPKILRELMTDGLLASHVHHIPQAMIELMRKHRIPTVWLNTKQEADSVHPDDFDAGRRATQQLIEAGHRRIAYVGFQTEHHYSAVDRRTGYERAMQEAGLTPRVLAFDDRFIQLEAYAHDNRFVTARGWFRQPDRPTAFVAYERDAAEPLACAAMAEGLSIPRDVSVVGFAHWVIQAVGFPITTYIVPAAEMGHLSVETLLHKIAHREEASSNHAIKFEVMEGGSVAAPRV